MLQTILPFSTLLHGIPLRPNTMTGEAWERARQSPCAALKLKGLCITARRSGSRKDGSISQKAANKGGEKISSSRERELRPLTPLLWHRLPVLRNTDCSQAAWSSHCGDTLQWPPLPTEGATCSLPHHPRTHIAVIAILLAVR
jgi:hypothetical protein